MNARRPLGVLAWLAVLSLLVLGLPGCSTPAPDWLAQAVTPTRLETVTAYAAARTVRAELATRPASREALTQTSAALNALVSWERWDLAAFADALEAGGLTVFFSDEGRLVVEGALLFNDLFAGVSGPVVNAAHVRAAIVGTARGFTAALAPLPPARRSTRPAPAAPDPVETLRLASVASR